MLKPQFFVGMCLALAFGASAFPASAKSRYVVLQSTSSDCGPAALATLLSCYLDIPCTEAEVVKLANAEPIRGTSLQGLEAAVDAKGGGAQSVRLTFDLLQQQLQSYPAPVIVRLLLPEPHFVVLLQVGDEVALADPAVGCVWMKRSAFLKRWLIPGSKDREGYVFIAARADGQTNVTNRDAALTSLTRARRALQATRAFPIPIAR